MTMTLTVTRIVALAGLLGVAGATVLAQEPSARKNLGLDPYKPSDAKILRDQGPAIVTTMPLEDLKKLDPYNPTDAALLRQRGGALPLCCPDLLSPSWPLAISAGTPRFPQAFGARIAPASRPNTVWVCRGNACASEDVRTHQFSKPPADPSILNLR